jgi:hypothetical protein
MRIALVVVVALAGGCGSGLAPGLARAHDDVRALYMNRPEWFPKPGPGYVEYLGDGCYVVDDTHPYGCFVDPRAPNGRTCLTASASAWMVRCRARVPIMDGSDCREIVAPKHCRTRFERHDLRHRHESCAVRMRTYGNVERDQPLEVDGKTLRALKGALGRSWSGRGPLVYTEERCPNRSTPRLLRSTGIPDLDGEVSLAMGEHRPRRCGITTVHVIDLETCVR